MESSQQFIKRKEKQFEKEKESCKKIGMKDIGRKTKMFFTREKWTLMQQSNMPQKVFLVEKLKKHSCDKDKMAYPKSWRDGDIEYRIGYYIIGRINKAENKWIWGQFCPIIPEKDLNLLINSAKKNGTIKKSYGGRTKERK